MSEDKQIIDSAAGVSELERSWKRLLKNKPAVGGILIIITSLIIAILGYLITPDQTPYSNNMILQIGTEPPAFGVKLLKVRKNKRIADEGIISTMLFGQEDPYTYIPINDYQFDETDIVVTEYVGEADISKKISRNMADVVYAKSFNNHIVLMQNDSLTFFDINDKEHTVAIAALKQKIEAEHIVKKTYLLGTDKFGRDILSRLIIGVRVSLSVGFIAVLISLVIGVTMGAIAGYFRGRIDNIIMWIINVIWSIPTLLLVFAITLALGKGFWQIFVAVGLSMWVEVARIIRGQVMSIREIEFVEATRALGYSNTRIITLHILPNVLGPVMVIAAANFAAAILIEAGLSFLGIGVQPPMPSWGWMMKEHYGYIIAGDPFLAIIPGLSIMMMVLAFNLLGNGLRDALDVKTKLSF